MKPESATLEYKRELTDQFEIFADRLKITSAAGLLANLSQEEFFSGHSVPRNKEIMRIDKDLELVEQLGSGFPRILLSYPRKHVVKLGINESAVRKHLDALKSKKMILRFGKTNGYWKVTPEVNDHE